MKAREIAQEYKTVTASAKEEEWEREEWDVCYAGRTRRLEAILTRYGEKQHQTDWKRDEFINPTYMQKRETFSHSHR